MMKYRRYHDIDEFLSVTFADLMKNEPLNELILTMKGRGLDWNENYLGTVTLDDGRLVLACACTPPYNAVLRDPNGLLSAEALTLFVRKTKEEGFVFNGVQSTPQLAEDFANTYRARIDEQAKPLVLMRLDIPSEPSAIAGIMRPIQPSDLTYLSYWVRAFQEDCHMPIVAINELHDRFNALINNGSVFVWEVDGMPVSMAASTRGTQNGAAINYVYTPPFYRGKGYAFACVGALSRRLLLEKKRKYCYLYADGNNPISNHVYHKIGYQDIGSLVDIHFKKA